MILDTGNRQIYRWMNLTNSVNNVTRENVLERILNMIRKERG